MISEGADNPCFDIYEVCKPALRDSPFSCKPYFELKSTFCRKWILYYSYATAIDAAEWTFSAGKLHEIVPQSAESHLYDLSNLVCLKSDPNNSIRFSWRDQLQNEVCTLLKTRTRYWLLALGSFTQRIFASGDRETVLKCLVEGCARAHHIADRTELFRDVLDNFCIWFYSS